MDIHEDLNLHRKRGIKIHDKDGGRTGDTFLKENGGRGHILAQWIPIATPTITKS